MYFLSFFLIFTSDINGLSIAGTIYYSESKKRQESVNIILDEFKYF